MTAKRIFVLLGVGGLLTAVFWYFIWGHDSYRETNAVWSIQGLCTSATDGAALSGAQVRASFVGPITLQLILHHGAPSRTNMVARTDVRGRFELAGEGATATIEASADSYDPCMWHGIARGKVTHVDTNLTFSLAPAPSSAQ